MSSPSPPTRRLAMSDPYAPESYFFEPVSLKSVVERADQEEQQARQMMRSLSLNDIPQNEQSWSESNEGETLAPQMMRGKEVFGNFFSGIADKKLQRLCRERIHRSVPIQKKDAGTGFIRTIFSNPLYEVRSWAIHVQNLLDRLNGDSTDTATIIAYWRNYRDYVAGDIRFSEGRIVSDENSDLFLESQKKIRTSAVDLWRIADKVQVIVIDNLNREQVVYKRSHHAYNQAVPHSPKRLNRRFLCLMNIFCPEESSIQIPAKLRDKTQLGVENWINKEFLTISMSQYFSCLLRTWSQSRYSGEIASKLFLHSYGASARGALPIQVRTDVSRLTVERKLFSDGSQVETIIIPLKVEKRRSDIPYCEIIWKLVYRYNGELVLEKVESSGELSPIETTE